MVSFSRAKHPGVIRHITDKKGENMANYVVLMKLTTEGAKNLKDAPQRMAKANEILAKEGA